ncbi:MAG: hypothetical protein EU536_01120 [Promethearchaeota archaeon]|nr:MAG: hypothetical protein EU536_01120 [Candidatus Lokiarchaeota archaeon]
MITNQYIFFINITSYEAFPLQCVPRAATPFHHMQFFNSENLPADSPSVITVACVLDPGTYNVTITAYYAGVPFLTLMVEVTVLPEPIPGLLLPLGLVAVVMAVFLSRRSCVLSLEHVIYGGSR